MNFNTILTTALTTTLTVGMGAIAAAPAQAETFSAGTASNGQFIRVDIDSINRASARSVNFIYYLGNERVFAQAHCDTRSWTTFPENQTQYPKSRATQQMVDFVCDRTRNVSTTSRTARVIDPPSNVRATPNGRIICSLERTQIEVFEPTGSWYRTNVCGAKGYIHKSQIQF
ncbi:hypothetical protein JOY44_00750 [Phormidium sp. CLA17]|uniref:hypothetical protein n=1 Tax=Leptolyngbya sp. Cla-17 TaxID=2803751 RepID=UPI0018DA0689|nr:hypothetical protein [Leptolyngbya sp. Cla-17]MBM0740184.1 hypothetical protein [Leptolyngbya sp. Cla-17]